MELRTVQAKLARGIRPAELIRKGVLIVDRVPRRGWWIWTALGNVVVFGKRSRRAAIKAVR